jgi:pseudaminic acid cytidylyltransferase
VRLGVIPARGGSKRIPRKNVLEFAGRPMISHSIGRALESGLFDRVIVSTDDPEIAEVSRSAGAAVPFIRPADLSGDHTGTTPVVAHAVSWAVEHGLDPSLVCCIYATAPFIEAGDLRCGLELMESGKWQYVFSATRFSYPIQRAVRVQPSGGVEMFFPEHFHTRSQDLPAAYHDAGQFYWGLPAAWLAGKRLFSDSSTIVEIPGWRVQDIDTPDDWKRAELLWRAIAGMDRQVGSP